MSLETCASRQQGARCAQRGGTNHGVGRVRDNGAEDTGNVTSGGGDTELLELVVRVLGLSELLVNLGDSGLEESRVSV